MEGTRNLTLGGVLFVASFAVFALLFWGGTRIVDLSPIEREEEVVVVTTELEITSARILFDKRVLAAPANTRVTITHHNNDAGVLHNIAFYRTTAATDLIFRGETFPGVATVTESFTTPGPGNYFYRCDVHPDTMTGTFVVVQQ
jgi:plastocyanin